MAVNSSSKSDSDVRLRRAEFRDLPQLARTAFIGYAGSPLDKFLSPESSKYPEDCLRGWNQRMASRWLDPRNISLLAYSPHEPDKVLGYAQFVRLGDDDAANRQILTRKSLWLTAMSWYYWTKFKIVNYIWPDRSVDLDALRKFESWVELDENTHWNSFPERKKRWHVQSVVVSPECRGKGVGTLLMNQVVELGSRDGVVIGLEASQDGEYLYRKVGFKLLSRFYIEDGNPVGPPDVGGVMMWTPPKSKDI